MSEPILAIGSFERAASVKERGVALVEFKIANGKPLTMAIPKMRPWTGRRTSPQIRMQIALSVWNVPRDSPTDRKSVV